MNSRPPDEFETTFAGDLGELLLEAVRSTYVLAIDCFKRAKPYSDGHTFGTDLYRFAGHKLSEAADNQPSLIAMVQEHPSFIHRVGKFNLICHRVAKESDADIWSSFPNPETEGVQRGATYFLPGLEPDLSNATTVVLAHIGNQDEGLCGLYVCVPVANDHAKVEWGHVHKLYARATQDTDEQVHTSAPEPLDVEPAVVRRRAHKKNEK